jgi:hypothetical protein
MKAARFAFPMVSLVVACSSKPSMVSMKIPPSGGTVQIADGTSVSIPAGALAQGTTIQIGSEPNPVSVNDVVLVGPVYRFGPEGTQFAQPVTVTLFYDGSRLPAGDTAADVAILTAPVGSADFAPLPTAIADGSHVSTTTTHFSDFVATVRKRPHEDLSASLVDLGGNVPGDQGAGDAMTDQGPNADQAMNPDMATKCPHTFNPTTCVLSANAQGCGGAGTFTLNCIQTTCVCQAPNIFNSCPKPSLYMNSCPPVDVLGSIWTMCCGFP